MRKKFKCPECNLVQWQDGKACKRCGYKMPKPGEEGKKFELYLHKEQGNLGQRLALYSWLLPLAGAFLGYSTHEFFEQGLRRQFEVARTPEPGVKAGPGIALFRRAPQIGRTQQQTDPGERRRVEQKRQGSKGVGGDGPVAERSIEKQVPGAAPQPVVGRQQAARGQRRVEYVGELIHDLIEVGKQQPDPDRRLLPPVTSCRAVVLDSTALQQRGLSTGI